MTQPKTSQEITLDQFKILTEKQWLNQVVELARFLGWEHFHPWISIHSPSGFPDLVLANPKQERIIYAELKTEKGKVSPAQRHWLDVLEVSGGEVYLWRPSQFDEVVSTLTRRGHARIAAEVPLSNQTTHR